MSSSEIISKSAELAVLVFSELAALQDESVTQYKALLNSIGEGKVAPGTVIEKQAELGATYDETWKLLPMAATAGTYAVVEKDSTTGRMSGLALTAKQRDEILKQLRLTFGDEVTKGITTGQISLVASAAILYDVIGNQPRKVRDK